MINSNFGFTPLKEVWIGDCYPESFYSHLPNEIADPFCKITEWTKKDTGKLQEFLEGRGITVRRPIFGSIDQYIDQRGQLIKPPITPRDDYLVLGKTLYSLHNRLPVDPWHTWLDYYRQLGFDVQCPQDTPINCLSPPSLVRVGQDLYIDTDTHQHIWGFICETMIDWAKTYRVNISATNGHSDGVFCPVSPGLIVSTHYKNNYRTTFPGWKVFHVPPRYNNFTFSKNWFVDDPKIENNQAFANHILNIAQDWVGQFTETVYEVNMLVIDEKNVVAMKDYPPLTEWLHQHGIEVHVFDLRTRSFWDGGWHCLTLDIWREDSILDLFPERMGKGVYWRFDPMDIPQMNDIN